NQRVLNHDQNNLRFFIECPSYKTAFAWHYTYVLKGYSDSVQLSDKEILEFQNLEPGDYTLEVKGVNNNGVFSDRAAVFAFRIKAPFWRTGWFIFAGILLSILAIYSIIMWRINKIRKKEKLKAEINTLITESRMSALQAQMNPHFIFNAINSIQSFILNNETQNAYDYLAKFAKLVRLVLNNSKQNSIKLQKEIETLQLYVQMEQIRFRNSFDFSVRMDMSPDDLAEITIPVMLIQPFIENAIWHGIMPLQEIRKGRIELTCALKKNYLLLTIEDNGVGRKASESAKQDVGHRSLGMQLVAERLALIEVQGSERASMKVIDLTDEHHQPRGTRIEIKLPNSTENEY
ncbi:MAG: histidine kinase, partial [Bacteroidota bacterium]